MSTKNQNILPVGTIVVIETLKGARRTKAPQLEGKKAKIVSIHPSGTSYEVDVEMGPNDIRNTHVAMHRCHALHDYKFAAAKRVPVAKPVAKPTTPAVPEIAKVQADPESKDWMAIVVNDQNVPAQASMNLTYQAAKEAVKQYLTQYPGHTAHIFHRSESYKVQRVIRQVK